MRIPAFLFFILKIFNKYAIYYHWKFGIGGERMKRCSFSRKAAAKGNRLHERTVVNVIKQLIIIKNIGDEK